MDLTHIPELFTMVASIVGATWYLGRAIGGVKQAIAVHVATDELTHRQQDERIRNLEAYRARR